MKFPRNFTSRFLQRGIFDLGFSSEDQEQEQRSTTNVDRQSTQTTKSKQTQKQQTDATTESKTMALSQDVQDVLEQLIISQAENLGADGSSASATSNDVAAVAQQLLQRAETAEAELSTQNAAVLTQARSAGTKQIDRSVTELAAGVGASGKMNSYVAQTGQEAKVQLEESLAALESQMNVAARGTATQEFGQAAGLLAGGSQAKAQEQQVLSTLVAQLKGATTTQTGQSSQNVSGETELNSLQKLNEIVEALTNSKTEAEKSGFSLGFGF